MIAAVVIAMIVMYVAAGPVGTFIAHHPTTKMLALAFLLLIGVALIADGFDFHIPRGYIYFAMAFAGAVEIFNVLADGTPSEAEGVTRLIRQTCWDTIAQPAGRRRQNNKRRSAMVAAVRVHKSAARKC